MFGLLFKRTQEGFFGNYPTWAAAQKAAQGYADPAILEKVGQAALKVKNHQAAYERDSICFDKKAYEQPLMDLLQKIAGENNGNLQVLDFGGSLGSRYFQHADAFENLKSFDWHVIEQPHFVEFGRAKLSDEHLKFFKTVAESPLSKNPASVLHSAGCLQYLPDPQATVTEWQSSGFSYLLFDRLSFLESGDKERITLQKTYSGEKHFSYPCRFFKRDTFLSWFKEHYSLELEFPALDGDFKLPDGTAVAYKGFLFKRQFSHTNSN